MHTVIVSMPKEHDEAAVAVGSPEADMSAAQSPDAAAVDLLWHATLPPGTTEPCGELVQQRRVLR
jgi:hypothetical protein